MASRSIADCHSQLQRAWELAAKEWDELYPNLPKPFITCTYRSEEEQRELYMRDKNKKDDDGDGKIDEKDEWRSNAKPGQSKHNLYPSEAIDICFRNKNGTANWTEDLFKKFAMLIIKHNVKWGGAWKKHRDTPHFEI